MSKAVREGFQQAREHLRSLTTVGEILETAMAFEKAAETFYSGLVDKVRSIDPAKPIKVNVIDVGDDPDRDTWESVAQTSGGAYQHVGASDSPEFAAAVNSLLG